MITSKRQPIAGRIVRKPSPQLPFSTQMRAANPPPPQQLQQQPAQRSVEDDEPPPPYSAVEVVSPVAVSPSLSSVPPLLPPRSSHVPPCMHVQSPAQTQISSARGLLSPAVSTYISTALNAVSTPNMLQRIRPAPHRIRVAPYSLHMVPSFILYGNVSPPAFVLNAPSDTLTIAILPLLPMPAGHTFYSFLNALLSFIHSLYPLAHQIESLWTEEAREVGCSVIFQSFALNNHPNLAMRYKTTKTTRRVYAAMNLPEGMLLVWLQAHGKMNFALGAPLLESFIRDIQRTG